MMMHKNFAESCTMNATMAQSGSASVQSCAVRNSAANRISLIMDAAILAASIVFIQIIRMIIRVRVGISPMCG